jgi:methionine aminopeptidase
VSIILNHCRARRVYPIYRSDPASELELAKGDVVKIHLGAHIDGFAATSAETLIVGATEDEPATGRAADVGKDQMTFPRYHQRATF